MIPEFYSIRVFFEMLRDIAETWIMIGGVVMNVALEVPPAVLREFVG